MDGSSSTGRRDSAADLERMGKEFPALVKIAQAGNRTLGFLSLLADIEFCLGDPDQGRARLNQLRKEDCWKLADEQLDMLFGKKDVTLLEHLRELWQFDGRSEQQLCFYGGFPLFVDCLRKKFTNRRANRLEEIILDNLKKSGIPAAALARLVMVGRIRNPKFCSTFEQTHAVFATPAKKK